MQRTTEEKRNIKMFLKELKKKGKMSFQDIMDLQVLSKNRNTVSRLLDELVTRNLIRNQNRDTWKKGQKLWHTITPKGERWLLETESENLKEACRSMQEFTESMSRPENVWRWRKEGAYVPREDAFERGYLTSEEITELCEHKEKVFGGLRHAFVDLTRVLLNVEGPINVRDDLSNVNIRFINGHPQLIVQSNFSDGRGEFRLPPELVEGEELNTRLAEDKRKAAKQDSSAYVLVSVDGESALIERKGQCSSQMWNDMGRAYRAGKSGKD